MELTCLFGLHSGILFVTRSRDVPSGGLSPPLRKRDSTFRCWRPSLGSTHPILVPFAPSASVSIAIVPWWSTASATSISSTTVFVPVSTVVPAAVIFIIGRTSRMVIIVSTAVSLSRWLTSVIPSPTAVAISVSVSIISISVAIFMS